MRVAFLILIALTGCAAPLASLTHSEPVATSLGQFELRAEPGNDAELARLKLGVERATPTLLQWGPLESPVAVYLVPDHSTLEKAVRRSGFDWLRAWAMYDQVLFQAPSTWTEHGANEAEVNELVLHELTHCVLFQRSGTPKTWASRGIPLWFREGMATWTAKQGYRFPTLEELAMEMAGHTERDLINDGEALSRTEQRLVYGAAHHAFTFLIRRYSLAGAIKVMDAMKAGALFDDAFQLALGIPPKAFVREFTFYVRARGFRGHGGRHFKAPPELSPVPLPQ